ncbi:UDP-glucuronate 5-epimerase [Blastococcus sp. TF02-09]|uniref:NAD-dependent epimerase/dehydratase family protein n=1 Tax=Blastococcus sp. TF02-09 TaxID=2250576 RepID=UPI000DEBF0D5|nr:NAD-dependent epimerase/dehydratase family protein [Blastococcus sp. TF02-9]RBY74811.1 UDP-glucuronate 5-epimerase [Blastococcus sp. TF02-9]
MPNAIRRTSVARTVVTGHAGFIGFHLAQRLLNQGNVVLGIDGMTDYYDPQLKRDRLAQLRRTENFTHEERMLEHRDEIVALILRFQPDAIVHLAAQAGVRYSLENPAAYIESNVLGTFTVLEAARQAKPKHLLMASTSSVYGGNQKVPFAETDRTDAPISLYAATKKAGEDLAHSYSSLHQLPTTAFRFFTVYGPWGRPDMALFKFVDAIQHGRAIDVYGNGEMRRDFTYIDDLVDGIVGLLDRPPALGRPVSQLDSLSAVAPFRSVNIGGGNPVGLMDFIAAIEDSLGQKARANLLPMQTGDMVETYAEPALLEALIGRAPRTPLSQGVREFVNWYNNYCAGFREE